VTWADDIDRALIRADSPYTAVDVLRWLRTGQAAMAVAPCLHGSVWFRDGGAELAHLAGRWCDACARWLYGKLLVACAARGIDFVDIEGRPGWRRFLAMRGFEHGR